MFPQIAKALTRGYTTKQVIDMILKRFPNQSGKIKEALAAGYTVDQIVKYLGGGKEEVANMDPATDTGVNTEYARTRQADKNKEQNVNHIAMQGSLAALGGVGAGMAAKAYQHALPANLLGYGQNTPPGPQPNLPSSPTPMGPGPNSPGVQVLPTGQNPKPAPAGPRPPQQQTGQSGSSLQQNINQPSQSPLQSSNLPQTQNIPQAINPQRDIKKSVDILKNLGQDGAVKNMLEGGLAPKDIAGVLKTVMPKDKFKALEAQEGGIEGVVEDFAQTMQKPQAANAEAEQIQPQGREEVQPTSQKLDEMEPEAEREEEERKPIERGGVVATPQGVGEVKEIRNGKAIVEVDGKKHQVDEDDLIESPISQDELADLHENLLRGIEKHTGEEISKNVEWAGYDPKLNELAYKPWMGGGKIYTYANISPEDVAELQDIMAERKTSGGNFVGVWEKNTKSPIGNRMHALITKLQKERGGKGNEYRSKYETIYDPTEPAKKAAQQRYKDEQKAKKAGQQKSDSSKIVASAKQHETKKEESQEIKMDKKHIESHKNSDEYKEQQKTVDYSYNLGKKYQDLSDHEAQQKMPEWMVFDEDSLAFESFEAGRKGKEKPYLTEGWRYGDIPEGGSSHNYAEDSAEPGISMMEVFNHSGKKVTGKGFKSIFADRPIRKVIGWLNTNRTGGDSEPLLMKGTYHPEDELHKKNSKKKK